jgi:hypothetical protein
MSACFEGSDKELQKLLEAFASSSFLRYKKNEVLSFPSIQREKLRQGGRLLEREVAIATENLAQ